MISGNYKFYRFLVTPGIEVTYPMFTSDYVDCASWRFITEEEILSLRHTNEVIGAYFTTGTRLQLYAYLDRLLKRALYCDTDGVLFI